jgi:hypothetical protein
VYRHSPGLNQRPSAPQVVGYSHSPDLNPYRTLQNFDPSPSTPSASTSTTSSFDWADAGIGAGALAGVLLLAGSMAIVVRKAGTRRLAV